MKANNTTSPCTTVSTSKCVVWSGPTLSCNGVDLIETGDNLTDVVYKIATQICTLYQLDDVSTIDVAEECDGVDLTNLHSLLESLISKICIIESSIDTLTENAPITYTLKAGDICLGSIGTEYTLEQLLTLVVPKVCSAASDVISLDSRVTILENQSGGTGSGLASLEITNITNANPAIVTTSSPHGFMDGYKILITDVVGMTTVNNNIYYVDVINATQFRLYTDIDLTSAVDSLLYPAYTSNGYVTGGGVYQPPTVDSACLLFPNNTQMDVAIEILDTHLCNLKTYVNIQPTSILNPSNIGDINSYLDIVLVSATNISDSIENSWETIEALILKVQALEAKINDCCTFSCKDYDLEYIVKYFPEEDTESGIVESHIKVYFTFEGSVLKPSNFVDSSTPAIITVTDQNGNSQTISFSWDDIDTNGHVFIGVAWADLSGPLTVNIDAYFNVMSGDDIIGSCHKCLNKTLPTPVIGCTTCELVVANFTEGNVIIEYTVPSESTNHALYVTSNGTYVIPGNASITRILNNLTILESPSLSITYGEGCGLLNAIPSITGKSCYQFIIPYLRGRFDDSSTDIYKISTVGSYSLPVTISLNHNTMVSSTLIVPPTSAIHRTNINPNIICGSDEWTYSTAINDFVNAVNTQLIGSNILLKTATYSIIDVTPGVDRVDIYLIFETYQTNNLYLELKSADGQKKVFVLGEEKTSCDNCFE